MTATYQVIASAAKQSRWAAAPVSSVKFTPLAMLRTIPLSRRGVYRVWGAAFLLLGLYLVPVLVSFCLPDPRGAFRGTRRGGIRPASLLTPP